MADETINTGGGASVGGDAKTEGGDFTGRDSTDAKATGNVVNVYPPASTTSKPRRERQQTPRHGEIMADAANELWKAISELNGVLGGLKVSVDTNTRATVELTEKQEETTKRQGQLIDEQGHRTDEQFKAFAQQIVALQRIEKSIRSVGIQMPDGDHAVPLVPIKVEPWWQPYLTPLLVGLILLVLIWFTATGGHFP